MRTLPALLLLLALPAAAQIPIDMSEDLDFDRPEAWAFKYFASVTMLGPFGVADAAPAGGWTLGLEGGNVPRLNEEQRRVGFGGLKVEDLNRTEIFGRVRAVAALPANVTLTIGYVPPIELDDVTPHMLAVAVARPAWRGDRKRIGVRLHAQYGELDGDFTCTAAEAAAGADPLANPFGCEEPSRDTLKIGYVGLEAGAAFAVGERFEPYVTASVNALDLELNADARYQGFIDRTVQTADGVTLSAAAGSSLRVGASTELIAEVLYAPLDVVRPPETHESSDDLVNFRAMLRLRLK